MLKKMKALLALISLLFSLNLFAGNCSTYIAMQNACGCQDAANGTIAIGTWNIKNFANGNLTGNIFIDTQLCQNENDTICNETHPSPLSTGDVLYVKNTSSGATDYFKCEITLGQNAQSVPYTPTPTNNSTVATPIPPFAYVLLALLFAGASILRLRK
jgi:hypothetical protein